MSRQRAAQHNSFLALANVPSFLLAGTLVCTAAAGAEWTEQAYDPPVGGRWTIQSTETTEEITDGHAQTSRTTMSSELTIDEKVADGFRIAYVVRRATYEGDARKAAIVGPMTKLLENLVVHATTAANGMPLHIENLDEVHTAARLAIDGAAAAMTGRPEAETWRRFATAMLIANDKRAPLIYLASLTTLALGQNTGLHPGETRRAVEDSANPFGGPPIKSDILLRIDSADPTTGNVRYVRTRAFDPNALKDFITSLAQRIGGSGTDGQKLADLMKEVSIALDSRAEIDVEGGMARTVREDDTVTSNMLGHSAVKRGHKMMSVVPAS